MLSKNITYSIEKELSTEEFIDILERSGLASRRPISNLNSIKQMLDSANLVITARDGQKLVGVSRSLTDFCFCCYLSDLAVDKKYQGQGIGKSLIAETRKRISDETLLLLLAAPSATEYYPKIGFNKENAAWSIRPGL